MKTEPALAPKKKTGRPKGSTTYDRAAVMTRVCEIIATSEIGIARILKEEPDMPSISKFWAWMGEKSECGTLTHEARDFRDQYARAKQLQAEYMENLLLEIADDSRNDYIDKVNKDGSVSRVLDQEHIQRSRLRVDTRKWLMAKLHPRKYAETFKHGGDADLPPVRTESKVEMIDTASIDALRERLEKFVSEKM